MLGAHAMPSNLNQMAASQLVDPSIVRLQPVVAFIDALILFLLPLVVVPRSLHTLRCPTSKHKAKTIKPVMSNLIEKGFSTIKCQKGARCFAYKRYHFAGNHTFIPTGSSVNRTISSTPCLQRGCFKGSHQRAKHTGLRRFNESSTSYSRPVQHVELANSANRTILNPHCRSAFQRSFASSQPCHPIKHLLLTQENVRRTCYAVKSQSNGSKSASRSIYRQASASGCFYRCSHPISAAACSGSKKLAHTQTSNKQTQSKNRQTCDE